MLLSPDPVSDVLFSPEPLDPDSLDPDPFEPLEPAVAAAFSDPVRLSLR